MKFYKSGVRLVLFWLSVLLLASCGESAKIPPIVTVQKALRMLTAENFEQGTYSYGNKADDTKQMRNIELIPVTKNTVVTYDPNGMALTFSVLSAPDASEYI